MRVIFSDEAKLEFIEAEVYYKRVGSRLGNEFRHEIRDALRRVRTWPLSCPIEFGEIRRLTLHRFPYKLLYSVEKDYLYIVAVAHQHRMPNYWVDRV